MQYRTDSMAEGTFYTYLFEKNLQGDIIAVYNTSGTKLISYVYDAWRNVTATNHNLSGTNTVARYNPFRYRGYYYDTETGYYYLQSMYYNPEWGRFLNADGQINEGLIGGNMYAYCANNPVMFVDPDGNIPKWFAATIAIGAGLVTIAAVASMLPAAACFAGFAASMYIGSAAAAVATTATYVAGTAVAISAGAYMADSIYNYYTDETVLLDTVFQGNVYAYQTGAMLTSVGTFGISQ